MPSSRWRALVPVAFAIVLATSPGCDCAGATSGICAQECGSDGSSGSDASSGSSCPSPMVCRRGCCECLVGAETCDGRDQDCDHVADDGVMACACAPGGPGSHAEVCNRIDDDCDETVDEDVVVGAETCNGVDDDCDGMIDDGVAACACAPGGPGMHAEVCNQIDDDCDGSVDEGLDPLVCPCAAGGRGPSTETCNGVDDDCDGTVDDGLDPTLCACAPGGAGRGPETCNGRDDDCNGSVDDNTMLCAGVTSVCACAPGGPGSSVEVCNGDDDDCDGMVDDGLTGCACTGCGMSGAEICNTLDDDCSGVADDGLDPALCACAPGGPGMTMEVCNRRDDDCDGRIDETSASGAACGGFGDPCSANADCSSTHCMGDAFAMYCTDTCTMIGDPGDCPAGYRCWNDPAPAGTDLCRRDYARCGGDRDCAAGEVCAPTCNDTGTAPVTECRPAIPGGGAALAACTRDAQCGGDFCFRTGFCSNVCASDADCAPTHRCVMNRYPDCGGHGYVGRCLDACDCDTECPSSQFCQPWVHAVLPPTTATTVGACDTSYGSLTPGADCDNSMGLFCQHAICSSGGTGFCTQVCSATCGCPTGIGPCGPSTVTFPDLGSYAAQTCGTM